ncbi:MAG: hypothetical protein KTR21_10810 [Rhodobacteraceae bacterium]|nr:hypothetical protein [Paracoccaceae bacterium]
MDDSPRYEAPISLTAWASARRRDPRLSGGRSVSEAAALASLDEARADREWLELERTRPRERNS